MRLLVLDTSADRCSVAVAVDEREPVIRSVVVGRAHAERLLPMIAEAMAATGRPAAGLHRIAVTIGPGSFTGVRIGVAAARGLSLATKVAAVGIGTLAVHAEAARALVGNLPVVVVVAAGRGEIYAARYAADGTEEAAPALGAATAFVGLLDDVAVVAGSGADALLEAGGARDVVVAHRSAASDVAALIRLAERAPASTAPPRPLYLRPPDARPQVNAAVARR